MYQRDKDAVGYSELNYDWIFDHAMSSEDPMDYKVVSVSDKRVLIRNKGVMDAPIHVVAFNGDEIVETQSLN